MHAVTLTTSKGKQVIPCGGANEAAQLALTLQCDGWDATVDHETYEWASDSQNFDIQNVWAIKEARS